MKELDIQKSVYNIIPKFSQKHIIHYMITYIFKQEIVLQVFTKLYHLLDKIGCHRMKSMLLYFQHWVQLMIDFCRIYWASALTMVFLLLVTTEMRKWITDMLSCFVFQCCCLTFPIMCYTVVDSNKKWHF